LPPPRVSHKNVSIRLSFSQFNFKHDSSFPRNISQKFVARGSFKRRVLKANKPSKKAKKSKK